MKKWENHKYSVDTDGRHHLRVERGVEPGEGEEAVLFRVTSVAADGSVVWRSAMTANQLRAYMLEKYCD